ncbi:mannose-1-phosphate guanylyltransferase/mannose-6-phosphate isomerase [Paenibacillus shunpengii]|uniref:mannose-1-phosphate guanylyltransferase n=1 Tax=Paenibacillus shunpengii TaxID=2054424 RepID=A0ABW5SU40_9BACL
MINVVLCGGNGTRLWPLSRTLYPKQFIKILSDQSLFQMTILRNKPFCSKTVVVSNEEQYFLALDHLREIKVEADRFILEPIGRNTAPAIALACLSVHKDELVMVTPSDHIVKNETEYARCINKAEMLANNNHLVTFGITPYYPETGYGYIESDGVEVISFKEKPDKMTAEKYIDRGNFYWNSGMFMFKAGVFLNELEQHAPEIYKRSLIAFEESQLHYDTVRVQKEHMESIPSNSIDYAVMENSQSVKMVPSDIGWSDLGSFESLYEELPKDENFNTISDNYLGIDSAHNLIFSEDRTIATVDVDDLIVVDTPDALLIAKQGSSQKVKEIVGELTNKNSQLRHNHVTSYRPWGHQTVLDSAPQYKIKRVVVKPGQELSVQKHYHRNEHWIVVSGTALVRINDKESLIRTNESALIPMGKEHSVMNPGKIDLILIEVQVGEYVEEDDVVRNDN